MRRIVALLTLLFPVAGALAGDVTYVNLPGGDFTSALKFEDIKGSVRVAPFALMRHPVSNGEFLAFVRANPQWRRDRVARAFAEPRYLSQWSGPVVIGPKAEPGQPVTWVSWFAANAYCAAQNARLPTWTEWEYVAAADETKRDARNEPAWRDRILAWYSRPSSLPLPRAGLQPANVYGVQDVHGLVWEWTDDYSALLVSDDNRDTGDADKGKFCGAGALAMKDPNNYAVLMHVAMLSALQGVDATANLGFRCARDLK